MLRQTVINLVKMDTRVIQFRILTNLSAKRKEILEDKMQAWQIHSYGDLNELKLSNTRIPVISRPTDVLIKVEAASINPIDVAMARGYGATLLNAMRKAKKYTAGITSDELEFPLTLGRDFSGIVVSKGHAVRETLKINDKVWGVVPVEQQGCHASYVVINDNLVNIRPHNLTYIEAASILYAGLTAWSALWITGGLYYKTCIPTRSNKAVLVLGGSGGVGSIAVQLLKAWNIRVIATCNTDAVRTLQELGADVIVDYKEDDADSKIILEGPYDIILDCCNQGLHEVKSKGYAHHTYITLNSPALQNIDQHGLVTGTAKNIVDVLKYNVPIFESKSFVKWGFFVPSRFGIMMIQDLIESGKVIPVVKEVYPFQDLPMAYDRIVQGHLRGKVVIDMK